jgi:hypothetical protein
LLGSIQAVVDELIEDALLLGRNGFHSYRTAQKQTSLPGAREPGKPAKLRFRYRSVPAFAGMTAFTMAFFNASSARSRM